MGSSQPPPTQFASGVTTSDDVTGGAASDATGDIPSEITLGSSSRADMSIWDIIIDVGPVPVDTTSE
jgi:hypothetical protein